MRRFLGFVTAGTFLAAAVVLLAAQNLPAQQPKGDHAAHHPQQGEPTQAGGGMMKMMKMSPGMKMHCRMMMNMEVRPTDPAALLALKDKLKLTDEQIDRLEKIREQAREQTEGLLTAEQKQQIEPLEKMPATCMAMHEEMMKKMMTQKGGEKREAKGGMMEGCTCPMMAAMQQEKEETHGGHAGHEHQHHGSKQPNQ